MSDVKVEAKFNGGNGGVILTIEQEEEFDGHTALKRMASSLLSPRKAIDLALEILHKATRVPDELDAAIRNLKR